MLPCIAGCVENELGLRQFLEERGHEYIVTDSKEGEGNDLDKYLPDIDIVSPLFYRTLLLPPSFLTDLYIVSPRCSSQGLPGHQAFPGRTIWADKTLLFCLSGQTGALILGSCSASAVQGASES